LPRLCVGRAKEAVISGLKNAVGGSSNPPGATGRAARKMKFCYPKGALQHLRNDAQFDNEIRAGRVEMGEILVAGHETFSKFLRLY
jgi:hypothetical protein